MVFKRPGNGRDDKPGRSLDRTKKSDERPKRTSSRGKAADQTDWNKPAPKKSTERSGDKKSASSGRRVSSASEKKPYAGKGDGDFKSSFTGGEKKSFSPRKPYSGRPSDGDSTRAPGRSKPYSGRVSSADSGSSDRPKRSSDNYKGSNDGGEKKPFSSRPKSYSGRPPGDIDRPKRNSNSEERGERKFNAEKPAERKFSSERSGERKFSKPSADGFKKGGSEPFRKSPKSSYNKITPDRDAPVKTLRSRKEKENKDLGLIRLNRYIANAGICSRRKADELIEAGVVSVNGEVVNELGHKVDPMKDEIRYNGELLKREKKCLCIVK